LLFLRKRLRFVCLALDLLSQGIDLPSTSRPSSFSAATSFSSASRRRWLSVSSSD
jgi:hypothetical protein